MSWKRWLTFIANLSGLCEHAHSHCECLLQICEFDVHVSFWHRTLAKIYSSEFPGLVRALASHRVRFPAWTPCGLGLLMFLSLAPRVFSPGTPVFSSPQKTTLPNSNSIWNAGTHFNEVLGIPECFKGKQIDLVMHGFGSHLDEWNCSICMRI